MSLVYKIALLIFFFFFSQGRWKKYVSQFDTDNTGSLTKKELESFFHKLIRLYDKRQGNQILPLENDTKQIILISWGYNLIIIVHFY